MKYVQINSVPHGSTGGIMMGKHRELLAEGVDSYVFWGRGRTPESDSEYRFGTKAGFYLDVARTRLDGKVGFHSKAATKQLLRRLDEIDPDVVHLHNIHGYYVNIEMLFGWLAKRNQKTYWTLHDCWAFTGHCAYFTYAGCAQWQTHCAAEQACPQLGTYPKTYAKRSCTWNFARKRELFTSLDDLTLITPSQWLADLVKQSYFANRPVEVRRNTVDKSVFKPTPSDFRERYGIGGRFMVLGVANPWTERKGLRDFVRLAGELDSSDYAIVLIGLNEKQIQTLSRDLLALPKIESAERLAEAYTAPDVFMHPSSEEKFGMTVVEAQACGAPVIMAERRACAEVADMSTLKATVIKLWGGGIVILAERTDSPKQLAGIYTASDCLFNPTLEDNYPTVNLEAEACGTVVLSYNTGGCGETLSLADSVLSSGYEDSIASISRMRMLSSFSQI